MNRPGRLFAILAVVSLVSSATLMVTVVAGGSQRAAAATADSSVSKTETITRDHLVNGKDQVVDTRTVTAKVDVTQHLKDRAGVHVTWTGAHPTGGVIFDQTSSVADDQEYPVAILQCRGVDSTSAPAAQQLSPQSCYTQVPEERYQGPYRGPYPAYRIDRYATPADRTATAGAPSTIPAACPTGAGPQHWVPFVAADGTSYYGGPQGCAGLAPEQSVLADPLNPPSTTFGTTSADGTGSATFIVQNSDSNASLGCSDTVACSIVIIPIMGISCDAAAAALPAADQPADPAAAQTECAQNGFYPAGVNGIQTNGDPNVQTAVSGQLWWSASNWRNRISVPITMAQTAAVCNVTGGGAPENVYGSQYAVQLTQQWAPKFCLDSSLFRLQQVQASEVQAKNLLANGVSNGQYLGVKAALQAGPPATPFLNPVVQAPTAVTGFAIAFAIDDAKHHAVTQLNLNPRLLAKLMTMSYPALPAIRDDWSALPAYKAMANNPLDVAVDPEFLALNPAANDKNFNQFFASATMFMMSSDSDVMTALTSYINVDPEARAWLNGQPDPWGMVVNPHYRKITLPVTSWPLKDTYYNPLNNECIGDNKSPILPLIAGPVSDPSLITFNMQYGISNAQVNCVVTGPTDSPDSRRIAAEGREQPGQRFLLGLVSLADARRYQLNTASLQTQKTASAPVKFSDGTGRTFVAPTQDSLLAAAKMMTPDSNLNTFTLPYSKLRSDSTGLQAYPGTLLLSTDVPTKGLSAEDGANFGKLLTYAAGPGQEAGDGNGQLPDGYVPITAANGLGNLVDYTTRAASEVSAQSAKVPLVTGGFLGQPKTPTAGSGSTPPGNGSAGGTGSTAAGGGNGSGVTGAGGGANAAAGGKPSVTAAGKSAASTAPQTLRLSGSTHALSPGWLGYAVPFLAILGLLSAFASVWLSGVGRR